MTSPSSFFRDPRNLLLNLVIILLAVAVLYLSYSFVMRHFLRPPVDTVRSGELQGGVIQLDVLNGCGSSGVATEFTSYLRQRGYDVVEMRNYKSFDVDQTLVIDRTGRMDNAEKVAYALGVRKSNIVQQINQDYYVDVSVLIGKDWKSLKPSQ